MLPIDNHLDNEYDNSYDIDYDIDELDDELLEDLDNRCEEVFNKINQYVIPFSKAFKTNENEPYDIVSISIIKCYLEYLRYVKHTMDTDSPIKEINTLIRVLELLLDSVNFEDMLYHLQQDFSKTTTNTDSYQVMSNVCSQMYKDIFRYQVSYVDEHNNVNVQID